jgi:hypothetical protein
MQLRSDGYALEMGYSSSVDALPPSRRGNLRSCPLDEDWLAQSQPSAGNASAHSVPVCKAVFARGPVSASLDEDWLAQSEPSAGNAPAYVLRTSARQSSPALRFAKTDARDRTRTCTPYGNGF